MRRRIRELCLLLLAGCSFGFQGGGLPVAIHTVAVLPFDNQTAEPALTQLVTQSVTQAMQSRLGLRASSENQADAVVRGKITRYDPDQPVAFQGTQVTSGSANRVDVSRRQVELTVDVTVVDQKTGHTLWDGRNLVVQGQYNPGREQDGRRDALDRLIKKIIEGMQQNW